MSKRTFLPFIAVALTLAFLYSWKRHKSPNLATTSPQVPQLASASQPSQNGFVLMGIRHVKPGNCTLAIVAPTMPVGTGNQQNPYSPLNAFQMRATTSTGRTWKVGWRVKGTTNQFGYVTDSAFDQGFPSPIVLVDIPNAYPPGTNWIEVQVADSRPAKAVWRLTNLPIGRDTIPSRANRASTYSKNGVFFRLDGMAEHWDSRSYLEPLGELQLSGCASPNASRKWRLEVTNTQRQWVSPDEPIGPHAPVGKIGTQIFGLPTFPNASLSKVKPMLRASLNGYNPAFDKYGVMYFDLLEFQVDSAGQETLLSRTPLSLTAPLVDKGPMEKLYPKTAHYSGPAPLARLAN